MKVHNWKISADPGGWLAMLAISGVCLLSYAIGWGMKREGWYSGPGESAEIITHPLVLPEALILTILGFLMLALFLIGLMLLVFFGFVAFDLLFDVEKVGDAR